MASRRSSGLVGAARKMGARLLACMRSRYSPASSTIMSVSEHAVDAGGFGARAQNVSMPEAQDRVEIGEDD